jgi:hypothetical protein
VEFCLLERVSGVRLESACLKRISRVEFCLLERVSGVRLESACLKRISRVEFCLLEKSQRSETRVCIPKERKRVKRVELCILRELQQFNVRILHYRIGLHMSIIKNYKLLNPCRNDSFHIYSFLP